MEEAQKLIFDVYGNIIKGKYVKLTDDIYEIEVISDSLNISKPGDKITLNKDFLIAATR